MQVKVKIIPDPFYHEVNSDDYQALWEEYLADESGDDNWEYDAARDGPPTPEFIRERFEEDINDDSSEIEHKFFEMMLTIELGEE
jgi:hypothetical protein